jgi:nitric oxide reductase NorE protein
MQRDLEQSLSRQELQKLRNNRTGIAIFQFTWILVFVCLVVVDIQLRSNYPTWPPDGVQKLGTGLPLLVTIGLIVSSFLAHRAYDGLKAGGSNESFLTLWRIVIALGLVFIVAMGIQWVTVPFSGQYSTLFRVMTAYHGIHALVIGLFVWRVHQFTQAKVYSAQHFWPIEAAVKLWDFVTVAWVLFFIVLYVI